MVETLRHRYIIPAVLTNSQIVVLHNSAKTPIYYQTSDNESKNCHQHKHVVLASFKNQNSAPHFVIRKYAMVISYNWKGQKQKMKKRKNMEALWPHSSSTSHKTLQQNNPNGSSMFITQLNSFQSRKLDTNINIHIYQKITQNQELGITKI